MAFFNTKIAKL